MSLTKAEIAAGIVPVSLFQESHLFFCYISLKMLKIPENMWVVVHTRCTTMFFLGGGQVTYSQVRRTRVEIAAGIVPVSLLFLRYLFFCYISLIML